MQVYPNPVKENTVVYLNYSSNFKLSLIDVSGRVLVEEEYYGEQHLIDTSNLTKGLYLINVIDLDSGRKFTQKLVKQ
jgi:hypothetical protein